MKRAKRRQYYKTVAPFAEIVAFITDNGNIPLEAVDLAVYFEKVSTGELGMKRRYVIYHNAAHMRDEFIQKAYCSVEMGLALPKQIPAEFQHVGVQAWRDFMRMKAVVDDFDVSKPLVFDWDMDKMKRATWNTHNNNNKCMCGEKQVCSYCWTAFAEPARAALLRTLRHWMGYKHVVCVYSGRRGFHTWVLDKGTRALTRSQRKSILDKLSNPIKGGPMYDDIYSILEPYHVKYHAHYSNDVWDIFYELDKEPTVKMEHLIGVPLVMNANTGVLRLPIDVRNFDPITDAKDSTDVTSFTMKPYAQRFITKRK